MPEYTLLTVVAVVAVLLLELLWLRSGIFRTLRYWLSLAVVVFFQVLVDGWLTRLSAPVVLYSPQHHSGLRLPWDIPVEDFGFGWAMVTLTILLWVRAGRTRAAEAPPPSRPVPAGAAGRAAPARPSGRPVLGDGH